MAEINSYELILDKIQLRTKNIQSETGNLFLRYDLTSVIKSEELNIPDDVAQIIASNHHIAWVRRQRMYGPHQPQISFSHYLDYVRLSDSQIYVPEWIAQESGKEYTNELVLPDKILQCF